MKGVCECCEKNQGYRKTELLHKHVDLKNKINVHAFETSITMVLLTLLITSTAMFISFFVVVFDERIKVNAEILGPKVFFALFLIILVTLTVYISKNRRNYKLWIQEKEDIEKELINMNTEYAIELDHE